MNPDPKARQYLTTKVNPILEKMVIDLVIERPGNNVVDFMVDWLNRKGKNIERDIVTKSQQYDQESDSDSDDQDAEDLIDINELKKIKAQKDMRTSVSQEVYGQFNKKSNFIPKVIQKSQDSIIRIKARLQQAFMFSALDENELQIVLDSMEEKIFQAGETVIKQGEEGDNLYVIDKGELDCYKRFNKNQSDNVHLKTYVEGEAFGELALLYNAPRAASIVAKTKCSLFSLDRETFNHIVKDSAAKKRQRYADFLAKVEILENMEPYERLQIADAIKTKKYSPGEYIVKEGDNGETFYLLETGYAKATKQLQGREPTEVYKYDKPGQYFGEIALLKNSSRAASVIAVTECTVVYLDRNSFARLLGPLEEILKRNFVKYEKYVG